MSVCLHCGEIGEDGALFCGKCGYTLPQAGADASPAGVHPAAAGVPAGALGGGPSVRPAAARYPPATNPAPYAVPSMSPAGAPGPIAPPPNAKFCARCGTPIAQVAVYCPVCQQPQP